MQASNESNTGTTLETGNLSFFGRIGAQIKAAFNWLFGGPPAQNARRLLLVIVIILVGWRWHYDYMWTQDRLVASERTIQFLLAPAIPGEEPNKGAPTRAEILQLVAQQEALALKAQGKAQGK